MSARGEVKSTWITIRHRRLPLSFRLDRRVLPVAVAVLVFTAIVLVLSISYGEYDISPVEVVRTIFQTNQDHPDFANYTLVVHTFRLPRILLAFLVGAALASSGAIMQGITRNPLADPFLLGVSGGAAVVVVVLLVFVRMMPSGTFLAALFPNGNVPAGVLPFGAFAGGLIAAAAIYLLAWKNGTSTPIRLILIGVAIESIVGAITTVILLFGDIFDVQQAYVWLAGSVYGRNWEHVKAIGGWLLVFLPMAFVLARHLNALNLGDDPAKGLGVRVERSRGVLLFVSVALAAGAVAVSGTIGFVGLVAPHIARRLVGATHEGLIPISAVLGGALVVSADLIGRWAVAPSELPVGIVTAMIGAPYFAFLLIRSRNA